MLKYIQGLIMTQYIRKFETCSLLYVLKHLSPCAALLVLFNPLNTELNPICQLYN